MDYYREIAPFAIQTGVAAAISYLPTALGYIPGAARVIDLQEVSKAFSPATIIALTVTAYTLTRLSKRDEGEEASFLAPLHDRRIYAARVDLVKKAVSLIALPLLGFSRGLANIAIANLSEAIANRIVLRIPPKPESMDF